MAKLLEGFRGSDECCEDVVGEESQRSTPEAGRLGVRPRSLQQEARRRGTLMQHQRNISLIFRLHLTIPYPHSSHTLAVTRRPSSRTS